MSVRENPVLLRQNFNQLWKNNIFLLEEAYKRLQFISLYKSKLMLWNLLSYRYTKVVSSRTVSGENDLDFYSNIYKYRQNEKRKRRRLVFRKFVTRPKKQKYLLAGRFEKTTIYQQVLQEFADLSLHFVQLMFRVREPIRRLSFMKYRILHWMRRSMERISRQKYFKNTIHQVILLHYYKVSTLFSNHLGRELQKVRKKVHWRLISDFQTLLATVPTHPRVGRHFYGLLIELAGRPKGRSRTVVFRIQEGSLASQTYRFRINMGYGIALAKVGVFGIRTRVAY